MPSKVSVLRVGFFLDGYTLKKVNEYYLKYHRFHSRLDFRELKGWVRDYVMRLFGREGSIVELESHYYHPYERSFDVAEPTEENGLDRLEKQLMLAGFEVHYNDSADAKKLGPNMQLVEDAYLYAYYRKIDVLVLLSTQGQYSSLPERLKRVGVPMLLLGWNFDYERGNTKVFWRTDSCLRELSGYYVAMEEVAEKFPPKRSAAKNLFMLPYGMHSSKRTNVWNTYLQDIMAALEESEPEYKNKCRYEKSPALARLG